MAAVDAHVFGGFGDVAVELGELVLNEFTLVSVGRILESGKTKSAGGDSIC